jgi:hypothetical protein
MAIKQAIIELRKHSTETGIPECLAELEGFARVEDTSVYKDRNRWTAKWRRDGKSISKHIGHCSDLSEEEAQKKAMRMKAHDLGIHYDTEYLRLSPEAIVEAVIGVTADFSDALDKAGIETPRGGIRRKLGEMGVEQSVASVNVEQGVIQTQGPVEQPVVQGSEVGLQTTPVEPGVVQSGKLQEDQPVPVELNVVQDDQGHVIQVPVELEVVQTPVEVAPDRKTILTFIRDEILAGHELQPSQVAAHFNISPSKMGKFLGIKSKAVRYGKEVKRVYAKSMLPEIEKLLKEDEKATHELVGQPVVQPVEHEVTLQGVAASGKDIRPVPVEPEVTPGEDSQHPNPRSWFVPIYHKGTRQSDKDEFLYKERKMPLIRVIKTEIGYRYTVNFNQMIGAQREMPRIFSEKEGLEHKIADFLYENQLLPADEQRKGVKKYMEEIK